MWGALQLPGEENSEKYLDAPPGTAILDRVPPQTVKIGRFLNYHLATP